MLTTYFDESGVHAGSRAVVLAGFVAPADMWSRFDARWNAALAGAGVTNFHATDCWMGNGEFQAISRPFREALRHELIEIACDSGLQVVASAVLTDAWESEATDAFRRRCPSPYALCFNYCIQALYHWSERHANSEPFALIFAEQQQFQKHVINTYDAYRASPHWGERLVSLSFMRAKHAAALQAADLIARETWQYISARDETKKGRKGAYPAPPPTIARMQSAGINFSGGMYDAWALRTMIANGENL